jgi:5-formaminoimidazole-4-carboxamide-1-(beta)-D-ribofuranosyl 5'-monophosphate synthetase
MITPSKIKNILKNYDTKNITIGVLGGHSALDVCHGAKKLGFKTLAVCQKGREKTYDKYYKTRSNKGCIDEVIVLNKFSDITKSKVQEELRKKNTIFIHNRYFWVYFDFKKIENDFKVPIYGTRSMLKLEERDVPKNQYYLMQKAGIRMPKIFKSSKNIDRLVIVKANELERGYERSFFFATDEKSYNEEADKLIKAGKINKQILKKAIIEEYIVGAQLNLNFFYSNLTNELELMGTDTRRQTNLDGLLRLPANIQAELLNSGKIKPTLVETGHIACTTKESIIEKMYVLGEKFVKVSQKECAPGIIGPFALQGAVAQEKGKEEIVIFDISMRIPGSPGTIFTPHTSYLYGQSISYGQRIAMEIKEGIESGRLGELVT